MIKFKNVSKMFNPDCVPMKNIYLDIARGEVVVICGPSGAGKSTLLRTINRLEKIDEGEIIVDNINLADPKTNLTALRAEIGMVFQHFNLFPHKTAIQNVMLAPRKVRGLTRKAARGKALKLLEKVGMSLKANNYPSQLSGGEQQRVAIARSLAMEPRIMLFDEPTSALDPELINEVLSVMARLTKEGMTMVVVTHELGFAQKVADRVVFMDNGEIVETGTPGKILKNPENLRTREFVSKILHVDTSTDGEEY